MFRTVAFLLVAGTAPALAADTAVTLTFGGAGHVRLSGTSAIALGDFGLQAGAVLGTVGTDADPESSNDFRDLRAILYRDFGRLRIGGEAQVTNDAVVPGADGLVGVRLRYSDPGGTIDGRLAIAHNGPPGAFMVTIGMRQDLRADTHLTGLFHRYSTNKEVGDFFAVGLGGETALPGDRFAYASGLWALDDDLEHETVTASLGIGQPLWPGLEGRAGVTLRDSGDGPELGLTASVSLTLGDAKTLFLTDPFGLELAHAGH